MKRRDILKVLGGASALSMCPYVGLSKALAAQDAPKRLLILSHCHGWTYRTWKMHPVELDLDTPWSIDLKNQTEDTWSEALRPLYRHRNTLIGLDGLSLATAELDSDGNRHDTGWVHAWTGNYANFSGLDTRATSPSIDQLIASEIARSDRLPSLELSVDGLRESGRPISYNLTGQRLPVENRVDQVWRRLFGSTHSPTQLGVQRGKMLAYAYEEFQNTSTQLGVHQQQKLSHHFELVHSLQKRLKGMSDIQCVHTTQLPERSLNYDHTFDIMSDLITAAFACDLTRVVSLSLGEMPTSDFGADHISDDVHKGLAHEIYTNADKHQAMTSYLVRHAEQVSRLVDQLSSTPDIDGRTLMDNTLIVWGSELADGWHGYQYYCPILIGGSWYFNMGRYHYIPHTTPIQLRTPELITERSGMPHQHLLVSVSNAMGLKLDRVGIHRIQSQSGISVDCAGPLTLL